MKLYLIERPQKEVWYDEVMGFVISATSPARAREIAAANHSDEIPDVWLDPQRSKLKTIGDSKLPEGVVLGSTLGG